MVILTPVSSSAITVNDGNIAPHLINGRATSAVGLNNGSAVAYNQNPNGTFNPLLMLKVGLYVAYNQNPNGTFNSVNPSGGGPTRLNGAVVRELEAIAREIGDDSLIGIERDATGTPVGIRLNYSPRRVGEILLRMARNQSNQQMSIVGAMRRLLGRLEAGRFIGLRVFSVDESGISSDTGILNSSSTVIGSTNQLISPSTQGFNAFSRAAEVLLAWLDVLALDPTSIKGDTVNVAGTPIPKADIEEVNAVLKQNPEIPAALQQFARSLETLNERQKNNIDNAKNLRGINTQLKQPNVGGGGGGGQGNQAG